jgi:hypothetical protein
MNGWLVWSMQTAAANQLKEPRTAGQRREDRGQTWQRPKRAATHPPTGAGRIARCVASEKRAPGSAGRARYGLAVPRIPLLERLGAGEGEWVS